MGLKSTTTIRTLPGSPGWYWYRAPGEQWQPVEVISGNPEEGTPALYARVLSPTDNDDDADNALYLLQETDVEELEGEWGDEISLPKVARPAITTGTTSQSRLPGSPRSSTPSYEPPKERVLNIQKLRWFLYWLLERHTIWKNRQLGKPKPWTKDPILQEWWFCNPYRELDKTTVWFRENVREPLRDSPDVIMATIIFRWFNYIPTGEILLQPIPSTKAPLPRNAKRYVSPPNLFTNFDTSEVTKRLHEQKQIFTSAHVVASGTGISKLDSIAGILGTMWDNRQNIANEIASRASSIQAVHSYLQTFNSIGAFFAYEICCDLRFTSVLEDAQDLTTWANAGPGAMRGLDRLHDRPTSFQRESWDWPSEMRTLYEICTSGDLSHFGSLKRYTSPGDLEAIDASRLFLPKIAEQCKLPFKGLHPGKKPSHSLPFELREVESCLCEFDKYMRMKFPIEGEYSRDANPKQMKRKYPGR